MNDRIISREDISVLKVTDGECAICKPPRSVCGDLKCQTSLKYLTILKLDKINSVDHIEGNSPPSVFIGSFGYPKVNMGPMVPPIQGNTMIYDYPEEWLTKSMFEILEMRSNLVYGKFKIDVRNMFSNPQYEKTLEMILCENSPYVEIDLYKKPSKKMTISNQNTLFGPSAPLKTMNISDTKTDFKIEKIFYDTDLRANDAIIDMYENNVSISKIQKTVSMGMCGLGKKRKIIPTRWSITAVDDIISKDILDLIKTYPVLTEYRVFTLKVFDNVYTIILLPFKWSYGWLEAWHPNTFWNTQNLQPIIHTDKEGFQNRTTYAKNLGGSYYAGRLAVVEALKKMRRQSSAIVFREIHEKYLFPLGVWNVREGMRATMKSEPSIFNNLEDTIKFAMNTLTIDKKIWMHNTVFGDLVYQKKILSF